MKAYERVSKLYKDLATAKSDHWRKLAAIERLPMPETSPWEKKRLVEEETARHKGLEAELWGELDKAKREEQDERAETVKKIVEEKRQSGGYEA